MSKPVDLKNIRKDVVYYPDTTKDCEVILDRIVNSTVYFTIISESNGGYVQEQDGTIAFPLSEGIYFLEKE